MAISWSRRTVVAISSTEEKSAVRSIALTLAARLLPTAVLTVAGWVLTAQPESVAHSESTPGPSSPTVQAVQLYAMPSAGPCAAVTAATAADLVPGAKPVGVPLKVSDPTHRTGCSWNGLKGYDYRWLDVTFEMAVGVDGQKGQGAADVARQTYTAHAQGTAVPGLGDQAAVSEALTTSDGQQTREAVVVVRKGNAIVTVTYNGSDFATKKAPAVTEVRDGALRAAKEALAALGARQGTSA